MFSIKVPAEFFKYVTPKIVSCLSALCPCRCLKFLIAVSSLEVLCKRELISMHRVKSCLGKQLCLNEIHKLGGGLSISYIESYSIIVLRGILSSFHFVENTTIRAVGSSAYRKYQDEAHFSFLPFAIVAYVSLK